jgi:CubicO group peptidase (beta-lactamase class C family)
MTATMIATLVEEGKLTWQTTIADIFPTQLAGIAPVYHAVDLVTLLSHRAGIADLPGFHQRALALEGPLRDQRLTMLRTVLAQSPAAPPGSEFRYSNWGYVIAGAMAEQVTGQAWEELVRQRLFSPLGMQSAGFGAPGRPDLVDQPWGHKGQPYDPVPPGRLGDLPPVYGPAGTVNCSLGDFVRYADLHARGVNEEPGLLLAPDSFQALHRDWFDHKYALGWILADRAWAYGQALTHSGSNTYWYHTVWIAPARKTVLLTATNCAVNGSAACDAAAVALVRTYLS